MISKEIKEVRIQKGYSQEKLAKKSDLSLRTIQRVENGETEPRGDTINRIAEALGVPANKLIGNQKVKDNSYLTSLHISALSFLLFPLLGILIPILLSTIQRDENWHLTVNAKKLLSFQITWNIVLFVGLLGYLSWWNYKVGTITVVSPSIVSSIYMPLYLLVGGLYLYNFIVVSFNIIQVSSGKEAWYKPRVNFMS
ncbi:helix-turn-helix transcriptional regulator [Balneolaceae bacterium YR4-1]|uniref:Helix-turn-helix transcriptional regulator n=1 Tax=Halalkalibaculum roseum TaxID=2709311 RepID=A0A6M1SWX0_9BACT|nr:helix-turn-helix transcriptional regulator [Halalkalibaculum roseum]NGP77550.1 helix-turn-helix transcriptional regulator [Halalkalibaculum roseum]